LWLGAHVRALEWYGGSVRAVVPDNLKSGVTVASWYEPELNPSYLEWARTYSVAILPARPYRPRDKAAAEVGVQVAERWILAPLRKRQFFSLAELNAAIAEQLTLVNARRFRGQTISRRDLFEELERDALQPLPATRYEFATWKPARVNIDYHVEFDARYYSAPYELARQAVEVRATANVVEIIHRGRRVASHARRYDRQRFITVREHMPAAHRAHLEWTPSKLVAWGATIGPSVAELMETILRTRPHPEHGYRACLGLMHLGKRYEPERMLAACQRALLIGSTSYRSVNAILKNGLDKVPLPLESESLAKIVPIRHANLRGAAYYQQALMEA
jgi:transposase